MLNKTILSRKNLSPCRIPIWNPVRSTVYTGCSLPDTWNYERTLYWHPESTYPVTLESSVRGLAHRKHWNPERQSSHTEGFLLVVVMEGLYYWSNLS
jgi:hypothetical protein